MTLHDYQKLLSIAEIVSTIDEDSFSNEEFLDLFDISDRLNRLIKGSEYNLDSSQLKAKLEELSPTAKAEVKLLELLGI